MVKSLHRDCVQLKIFKKGHRKSIPSLSDGSPLTCDESFLSWWERSCPGWLRPHPQGARARWIGLMMLKMMQHIHYVLHNHQIGRCWSNEAQNTTRGFSFWKKEKVCFLNLCQTTLKLCRPNSFLTHFTCCFFLAFKSSKEFIILGIVSSLMLVYQKYSKKKKKTFLESD